VASLVRGLEALFLLSVLAGCGPTHPLYLKKGASVPLRIAVLPVDNMTTDLDGPPAVRALTQKLVGLCGFGAPSQEEVDGTLKDQFGITDGGQLPSVSAQKLGEGLKVDGLLYGNLEEFSYINIGFFQKRTVQARFWLVDAATGEKVWEDEQKVSDSLIVTDLKDAEKALAVGLGVEWAEKMLKITLLPETTLMLNRVFETFPKRANGYLPVAPVQNQQIYHKTWNRRMQ
jgi:hypothetical protein